MLSQIGDELQAAVTACGEFRNVIATSPWAKPVRTAFETNLALPIVTGRIAANGKGTFTYVEFGNDDTVEKSKPIMWTATNSTLSITKDGVTTTYSVSVETFETGIPQLKLTPASGDVLESMPSECQA